MKKPPKVIDFGRITNSVNDDIKGAKEEITQSESDEEEERQEINDLLQKMQPFALNMKILNEYIPSLDEKCKQLNIQIDNLLVVNPEFDNVKYSKFPKLSIQDNIVCGLVGILSALIDVIFVGTPEVVKIYRGGENFDGSILTKALRKIGNDGNSNLSQIFQWFSDKCKVPYDIPLKKDVLTPNNHRLRSFAHDPFFGLLFAVADIILGTTTCINDECQHYYCKSKESINY